MPRSVSTAHAVVRHLRRVRGVDITGIKRQMRRDGLMDTTDGAVLNYIRSNTTIDIVQSVCSVDGDTLRLAVRCGARAVLRDGCRYEIAGHEVVATVVPIDRRYRFHRARHHERRPNAWKARIMKEIEE